MNFKPIQQLQVSRTLFTGEQILVGILAQNSQGVYFSYQQNYALDHASISPFKLPNSNQLTLGPNQSHNGLHGVFSDSLPDG